MSTHHPTRIIPHTFTHKHTGPLSQVHSLFLFFFSLSLSLLTTMCNERDQFWLVNNFFPFVTFQNGNKKLLSAAKKKLFLQKMFYRQKYWHKFLDSCWPTVHRMWRHQVSKSSKEEMEVEATAFKVDGEGQEDMALWTDHLRSTLVCFVHTQHSPNWTELFLSNLIDWVQTQQLLNGFLSLL